MQLANFGSHAPRPKWVNVQHDTGTFKVQQFYVDNGYVKSATPDEINVVILGLVRQREFWTEDRHRACESPDATVGYPTSHFPPYDQHHMIAVGNRLNCKDCPFHKWKNNKPPLCREQWVLPVLFAKDGGTRIDVNPNVYYIKFTYSSIRKLEKYLTPFRDSKTPAYVEVTNLKLNRASRDGGRFSICDFKPSELGRTPESEWQQYSDTLRVAREELLAPPTTHADLKPIDMGGGGLVVTRTGGTNVPDSDPHRSIS